MVLTDNGENLDLETISEFEAVLNVVLPDSYKEFMLTSNGGMPEEDWVFEYEDSITNTKKRTLIQDFFIIYKEDNFEIDNLKNICNQLWDDRAISRDMFPFAEDPAGNYICISLEENCYGTIYFCDHEFEDLETEHMIQSKIADNFSDFLKELYIAHF